MTRIRRLRLPCWYPGRALRGRGEVLWSAYPPDCVIAPDGLSFLVRAERQGLVASGRHYAVVMVATDDCGNASAATEIGTIYVPHDQSPHESCIKTSGRLK